MPPWGRRGANCRAQLPGDLRLPDGFREPRVVLPGILTIVRARPGGERQALGYFAQRSGRGRDQRFPLIVLVDDSEFTARSLNNFLWVTFTRSNPAADIDGIGAFVRDKHWGCDGSLVIDARRKPHHAPPLVEDPAVSRRVERWRRRAAVAWHHCVIGYAVRGVVGWSADRLNGVNAASGA